MDKLHQSGITLLELLVAIFIAGIVLGLGIPSMVEFQRNARITTVANDMIAAISVARAEAVKRRAPVTLCPTDDPAAAAPACVVGANAGWIVFADDNDGNGDGLPDGNGTIDAGEDIIRVQPFPNGVNVFADGNYISIAATGFTRDIPGLGAGLNNFLFCDVRGNRDLGGGNSAARTITVAPTGRPQVYRDVARVAATLGGCP
ncbi:MAG: hypothetical protein C0629_04510 [Chromatiales bacterium]|jgi:type IV fimbrial biogenesis protein FimT|nr:GspH/FimT family pseudopilin [Chromatiales bacterium]PLX57005.1 MAG: hypothetical protein C0629_04510 [Chromatiales bacterium]